MRRTTGLRRTSSLRRRVALRPMSDKRKAQMPERRALVERMIQQYPRCQFPTAAKLDGSPVLRECQRLSVDVHEVLSRGRGGDFLDETNCLPVCRWHHTWCHDHPDLAERVGALRHSWDR